MAEVVDDVTHDTLMQGRIHLIQPAQGFRSSLDPVLLAGFIAGPVGRFVDVGCGTGAVSFLLADKDPEAEGVAVEIQPRLAALAQAGCDRNAFGARLHVLNADVRRAVGAPPLNRATFDLLATNPPFRPVAAGVTSPDPERAQANHEVTLALDEWLDCAARLLKPGGRLAAIFPAERLVALLAGLAARPFALCRLRFVHPHVDRPASRVLIEARHQGRQTPMIEPPLILHESDGTFRGEIRRWMGEGT